MKRIKINAYQVGLVFKNKAYDHVLLTGTYWFWRNETVIVYDITKPFIAPVDLDILLQDKMLADVLHVVDVKDDEIAVSFENGQRKEILTTGRHVYWKSLQRREFVKTSMKS